MNKPRNNFKPNAGSSKRATPTNFTRKVAKLDTSHKTPVFEENFNRTNLWSKRPNDSWDY